MSRIHIRFIKEQEAGDVITYRVDCPDFCDAKIWEPIAQITINRRTASYVFEPLGKFVGVEIVPPFIFEMPEKERDRLLDTQYAGHAYGGWTARIANVTRRLLVSNEFPDEAYGITQPAQGAIVIAPNENIGAMRFAYCTLHYALRELSDIQEVFSWRG